MPLIGKPSGCEPSSSGRWLPGPNGASSAAGSLFFAAGALASATGSSAVASARARDARVGTAIGPSRNASSAARVNTTTSLTSTS